MGIFDMIWCALVKFVNMLSENVLQHVINAIAWVIGLLPSLPFAFPEVPWGDFGKSVGYFIPIGTIIQHFVMMLALVVIWYGVEYVMRWIKMIK